jgi:hypothetical protein
MLQLIYALKKHNNWRFPTRDICNYNFYRDRAISAIPQITMMKIDLESILWDVLIAFCNALEWDSISIQTSKKKYTEARLEERVLEWRIRLFWEFRKIVEACHTTIRDGVIVQRGRRPSWITRRVPNKVLSTINYYRKK